MDDATGTLESFAEKLIVRDEPAEAEEAADIESEAPEESDVSDIAAEGETEADDAQEDEGDDAPEEAAPETTKFKVKVDGEEIEVTQEELLRGYSGQAKVQKGMRDAAEARKQVEAYAASLQEQREAVFAFVQEIQQRGSLVPPPAPVDHSLAESDPVAYVRENARYNSQLAQYMQQQQQLDLVMQQHSEVQRQQEAREIEEGTRKLLELIPELADAEKAPEVHRMIVTAGERYGYSREEIGSVKDPRALTILHKAALYDAQQAATRKARESVKGKVATAGPILKPTAKPSNPAAKMQRDLRQRLNRSGSIEDAAALLLKRN